MGIPLRSGGGGGLWTSANHVEIGIMTLHFWLILDPQKYALESKLHLVQTDLR